MDDLKTLIAIDNYTREVAGDTPQTLIDLKSQIYFKRRTAQAIFKKRSYRVSSFLNWFTTLNRPS
jgi:hypothetical protein